MQVGVPIVVWRAALTLSNWLDKHLSLTSPTKALELGSGTGLLGLFTLKKLPEGSTLTFTDMEDISLDLVRANL